LILVLLLITALKLLLNLKFRQLAVKQQQHCNSSATVVHDNIEHYKANSIRHARNKKGP